MKKLPGAPFLKIGWVELKKMDVVFLFILGIYLAMTVWLLVDTLRSRAT